MPFVDNTLATDSSNEILLANLYRLIDILSVLQQNLNSQLLINQGNNLTVSNGNLFAIASQNYTDATLWTEILSANESIQIDDNGFFTPNVTGITSLIIPPQPPLASGGIVNV